MWFIVFSVFYHFISQGELRCLELIRNRKGQGLVEYTLIIAAVVLVCAVGITIFGHKVAGMIDVVAAVLPGAHTDCNGPIADGQLIETNNLGPNGAIQLDTAAIITDSGTQRLTQNLWGVDAGETLAPDAKAAGPGNGGG